MIHSRRRILQTSGTGFGWLAFAALAHREAQASAKGLAPKQPHHPARAKRVIMLTMPGGPSHLDTFDYKPQLIADAGKPGLVGKARGAKLMASPFEFSQHGESGLWISSLFPHVAQMADELCLLRSMHTDIPDHTRAQLQMHTGKFQFARPSLGVWSLYGLGTVSQNLPGYVWLDPGKGNSQILGNSFLPPEYRGTGVETSGITIQEQDSMGAMTKGKGKKGGKSKGKGKGRRGQAEEDSTGIANLNNPQIDRSTQRQQLDFIQSLNRAKLQRESQHPGVEGIIESYELAFRMQDELPRALNLSSESAQTREMYGIGDSVTDKFGKQCLTARKLAESGVRFIELSHGPGWDTHAGIATRMPEICAGCDKPIAGLLRDLKQRDMLKDTLVVWSGEFGRTPHSQGGSGRDHNANGYTSWMAGGGVKGGFSYGSTDEYGYEAVEDKMHIHDWHATILHLLGLDHERLTYRYAGRDFRLTDVYGHVAKDILA